MRDTCETVNDLETTVRKSDDNDVELQSVRAELEPLVRARALGGWTDFDEERYRVLYERERELRRDDESRHDEDA